MAQSSLLGTLAKVAIGVAVAKGAKAILSGNSRGQSRSNGLFGSQYSNNQASSPVELISGLLSGGQNGSRGQGGIGGILEGLAGNSNASSQGGGLNSLVNGLAGQMGGNSNQNAGGLGALLGGLAAIAGGAKNNDQSFGSLLNQAVANKGQVEQAPSADQEAIAGLMLVAMIQAAKSDGKIDKEEVKKFTSNLGDVDQQEMAFIQKAMEAPVDAALLAQQTPRGLEAQVYTMSVLGIDLDNQKEAQYLDKLANAYGLSQNQVNEIHDQLGVARIYN